MADSDIDSSNLLLTRGRYDFLLRNLRITVGWAMLCLTMAALLWHVTLDKARTERMEIHNEAIRHASSHAKAYAEQLTHSMQQIDQITRNLKLQWERSQDVQWMEESFQKGLLPSANVQAMVIDRNGMVVAGSAGTGNDNTAAADVASSAYFRRHRDDPSDTLLVTEPARAAGAAPVPQTVSTPPNTPAVSADPLISINPIDPLTTAATPPAGPANADAGIASRAMLRFSRRLESSPGVFDGVVVIAVEPGYLASFYDQTSMGANDFLSVIDGNGVVLASKPVTGLAGAVDSFASFKLPGSSQRPRLFDTAFGATLVDGRQFADGQARFIAWSRLANYPMTAVVGVSEASQYVAYGKNVRDARYFAIACSVGLLLLAIAGAYVASRLAWRKQQADDVRATYRLAVDGANEGFYMVRALYDQQYRLADFLIEDCNERGASLVGHEREALVGTRFLKLYSGEHAGHLLKIFAKAMDNGFYEDEVRVSPRGPLKARWLYRRLVRSGAGIAMTVRDISEIKAHEQALSDLANLDTLTGLPNRYWFKNHLPATLEEASRDGTTVGLLFVDLDDFKNINDSLGHGAGDELLKAAALRLKCLVRPCDRVVRLGGDEFTIVLGRVAHRDDVARLSRQIIRALSEPFMLADQGRQLVRASIGISLFPQDGADQETLLKHADIAMYVAKANGKARYEFYETGFSDRLLARIDKEASLRQAIERDEFVVYYQPRVDTFSGDLCGMEALIRWIHPQRGLLLPEEFIQVAEDTGLILRIGELVIDKTIAQLATWKGAGLPIVPVSINVSALQFDEGLLRPTLSASLARYDIAASMVEIEITESSMMGGGEEVSNQLTAIQALGIKLLVDDFGTGYSSLSQLQRLDMDVLKIDRAFTSQLSTDASGNVLFKAIVAMAHAMGMRVVAEGVETPGQLHVLQQMHCNEIQGFLISRAVPACDIPAIIRKRSLFPQPKDEVFQLA
jgi:diguanylate cyclase (GGDEF)-like protein